MLGMPRFLFSGPTYSPRRLASVDPMDSAGVQGKVLDHCSRAVDIDCSVLRFRLCACQDSLCCDACASERHVPPQPIVVEVSGLEVVLGLVRNTPWGGRAGKRAQIQRKLKVRVVPRFRLVLSWCSVLPVCGHISSVDYAGCGIILCTVQSACATCFPHSEM